jgi:dihydroorotate dehydrogenase electron transfer subunit
LRQLLAKVISNIEILPGTYLLWAQAPEIAASAQPGQFVMVRCGERYNLLLRRPFSIHQVTQEQVALLFKIVGQGTQWLSQRREGDSLDLLGPLGKGFSIDPSSHNLLMIAGGIGITPLVFLAEKALNQKRSVTLLLGAPTAAQLYPKFMLPSRINLTRVTEDGSEGEKGMATDFAPDLVGRVDQVFACGPTSMYQTISSQNLLEGKLQISLEVRMGCGMGACYGCTIKTKKGLKQVCRDGPVFELEEIDWRELGESQLWYLQNPSPLKGG